MVRNGSVPEARLDDMVRTRPIFNPFSLVSVLIPHLNAHLRRVTDVAGFLALSFVVKSIIADPRSTGHPHTRGLVQDGPGPRLSRCQPPTCQLRIVHIPSCFFIRHSYALDISGTNAAGVILPSVSFPASEVGSIHFCSIASLYLQPNRC
jgi:hypothetical protein